MYAYIQTDRQTDTSHVQHVCVGLAQARPNQILIVYKFIRNYTLTCYPWFFHNTLLNKHSIIQLITILALTGHYMEFLEFLCPITITLTLGLLATLLWCQDGLLRDLWVNIIKHVCELIYNLHNNCMFREWLHLYWTLQNVTQTCEEMTLGTHDLASSIEMAVPDWESTKPFESPKGNWEPGSWTIWFCAAGDIEPARFLSWILICFIRNWVAPSLLPCVSYHRTMPTKNWGRASIASWLVWLGNG